MTDLSETHFLLEDHMCFQGEPQGFEGIEPLNIIVGRNNSGKSTLLDVLRGATWREDPSALRDQGLPLSFLVSAELREDQVRAVYSERRSTSRLPGHDNWDYGENYVGNRILVRLEHNWRKDPGAMKGQFVSAAVPENENWTPARKARTDVVWPVENDGREQLADEVENPLSDHQFVHLLSDRDLAPEKRGAQEITLSPDGTGTTTVIEHFLNDADRDESLVEERMLEGLNQIFRGDARFERIEVQRITDETWEVFLEDADEGFIPLANSGSGLKTVLLVLARLFLAPDLRNCSVNNIIFAFEELENNLHPAAQRRFFSYLREFAVDNDTHLFITTHSGVVIDQFSSDPEAQLLHVEQEDGCSTVTTVDSYGDRNTALDTLGVRASDLLQANGLIWVEGPSDRIYINRWIELWTDGAFEEGVHYQCVFYGGALLAQHTAEEPADEGELAEFVELLRVNRNAIVVADSDREEEGDSLKPRVRQISEEAQDTGVYCWITDGREIENYLTVSAIRGLLDGGEFQEPNNHRWMDYPEYISEQLDDRTFDKVPDARKVCEEMTREDLEGRLDLAERLEDLCSRIAEWNNLEWGEEAQDE